MSSPIRILYICIGMNDLGGTNNHLLKIIKNLERTKFHPTLFVGTKIRPTLASFFKEIDDRLILVENYKAFFYIPLIFRICRLIKRERIQIMHSFQLQSDIIAIFSALISGVTVRISSFEGRLVYGSNLLKKWLFAIFNWLVRPFFSCNVFISQFLYSTYGRAYHIPEHKRFLNYTGVEDSWFVNPPRIDPSPNPLRIGYVGRLASEKGWEYFVEAVKILKETGFSAEFFIVGDGPDRLEMKSMVERMGLTQSIFISGWSQNVKESLRKMDIVVLPSKEEGLSAVAIEALSQKRVVIASNIGGLPEIIENEISGILIEPRNPSAISEGIVKISRDWKNAMKWAENGYIKVKKRFSIRTEVRNMEVLYQHYVD